MVLTAPRDPRGAFFYLLMTRSIRIILAIVIVMVTATAKQYTILISFDGFRHDYLDRGLSPHLQAIANAGVRAASLEPVYPSKTFPNHIAIVTGMYADHHGIIQNDFFDGAVNRRYKITDTAEVRDARWYKGEALWETAHKQGKVTASYFWPGSEISDPQRHPDYFERYEMARPYITRINGVLGWLDLPAAKRPDLVTLYFDATDTQGHRYGPDSPEVNGAIAQLDSIIGILQQGLTSRGIADSTNLIILSDHGMAAIDLARCIPVYDILKNEPHRAQWNGPTVMIEPTAKNTDAVVNALRKSLNHAQVYRKEEFPEHFHFRNYELISPVIITADLGWSLLTKPLSAKDSLQFERGNHGYDNHLADMHGIFIASGPAFRSGYRTGTLRNIDIYPMICRVLGIQPNPSIDGKLDRIGFILK